MISFGDRIKATPIILPKQGAAERLERIPLNRKVLQEGDLQRLIHDFPSLLPTDEVEPVSTLW